MSKHPYVPGGPGRPTEADRLAAIDDIARQIAVLVVKWHRLKMAEGGTPAAENAPPSEGSGL